MRKYYLDNIRYFTIIVVVFFHLFFMYNGQSIPGVLGAFYKNQIQDVFQYITYPWIMIILFIISGISSNLYLKKFNNFILDRTNKLLVPSTIGLLVFGWTQGYYNMLINDVFSKNWGLGIGDWGLGIGPNPQSPIPIPIINKILI